MCELGHRQTVCVGLCRSISRELEAKQARLRDLTDKARHTQQPSRLLTHGSADQVNAASTMNAELVRQVEATAYGWQRRAARLV